MIKWEATKEEQETISRISKRAYAVDPHIITVMDLVMDIEATHCNGCELKLEALEKADDGNFFHDVYGIIKNINRQTGKLENCFLPRYSA